VVLFIEETFVVLFIEGTFVVLFIEGMFVVLSIERTFGLLTTPQSPLYKQHHKVPSINNTTNTFISQLMAKKLPVLFIEGTLWCCL
jgi:hypothetical protein